MRCNRRLLFVIQQSSLCVSVTIYVLCLIYCCLSSYNSSNIESSRISKLRQRKRNIRAKADHVTYCVFLPAHTTSNERGYTQIGREACRVGSRGGATAPIVSGFHCARFAPGKLSLRREFSLAFLMVPALLLLRRSGGCALGNRRWIRLRE